MAFAVSLQGLLLSRKQLNNFKNDTTALPRLKACASACIELRLRLCPPTDQLALD